MPHESLTRPRRDSDQMKAVVGSDSHNDSPEVIEAKHHNFSQLVGSFSIRTLQEVENHVEHDRQSRKVRAKEEKQNSAEVLETEALEAASHSDETCTRYDIQKATASLMKHTEDNRQELGNALRGRSDSLLPQEVVNDIQNWIRSPKSRMMWIQGIPSFTYASNLSLAALRLCAMSLKAQIPCVSFFCRPRSNFPSAPHGTNMLSAEISTVALLYSVIAQLSRLIPADFQGAPGLDKQIQLLDGSIASATTALQVIRDLLEHAPPSTIWVIDGLNLPESHSTNQILNEFVAILRKQEQLQVSSKACFTTDGNSRVLMSAIMVHERVDASRMALAGPGRRLRGSADVTTGLNSW